MLGALRFDNRAFRNENDKFAPIRSVFERIVAKFRSSYKAGEMVTVDEQLVTTRGDVPLKCIYTIQARKIWYKLLAPPIDLRLENFSFLFKCSRRDCSLALPSLIG